jgi:hypothetical protein
MADLPRDRVVPSSPFSHAGIDVMGPWKIHDGAATRRTTANKKTWAVLFTCLSSRAVHIEMLPSLDTTAMKNALLRFMSVRGSCELLRSDRGTNFISASKELNIDQISLALENEGCRWEFNPPHASHFGGVWERKIGQIKIILDAPLLQMGEKTLSRDDLHTFLQEAAAIVNSTPLWEISNDPNDPVPLSPAMLLTMRSQEENAPEAFTSEDLQAYGKKRWRRVQYLIDEFWKGWKTHYLQTLQVRQKWVTKTRSIEKDDLVLLKDKNSPRKSWQMGIIVSVKKSSDNLVRSATVKVCKNRASNPTYCSVLERPISSFVLLIKNNTVQ